jgi:hypothetical protein
VGVSTSVDNSRTTFAFVATRTLTSAKAVFSVQARLGQPEGYLRVSAPSAVVSVGDHVAEVPGDVADLEVWDPINQYGQIALFVATTTNVKAVLRATAPRKPLLVLPGIGGTFIPENGDFRKWLLNRGADPNDLVLDPIQLNYASLIKTLTDAGYKLGHDLFIATYDWRLPPAPNDQKIDGTISGLTAAGISDSHFESGVDYLGYWLRWSAQAWGEDHNGAPLESVDVIAHTAGGLIVTAYIQSSAYGAFIDDSAGPRLPTIDNFLMMAVPNRGAPKAWNPLHDNWASDVSYRAFFSQIIDNAFVKCLTGKY